MFKTTLLRDIVLLLMLFGSDFPFSAAGQTPLLSHLPREASPRTMTAAERAQLDDPFFQLVLRDHPSIVRLNEIENLIQPHRSGRRVFVVDEQIISSTRRQFRRAVIAFEGTNQGLILSPNIMLSTMFNSEAFPEDPNARGAEELPFLEVWGWDANRSRYNYYRLDRSAGVLAWIFRGSSDDANTLTATERRGTCFQCHINGAPIMKELLVPWNNWHSNASRIGYLDHTASEDRRWPVATDVRLVPVDDSEGLGRGGLSGAGPLDKKIREAIDEFVRATTKTHLGPEGETRMRVSDMKALLKSLFHTTEFNITSSQVKSRMHPPAGVPISEPGRSVDIPANFFLNAALIGGEGEAGFSGFQVHQAIGFPQDRSAEVRPSEYKKLINSNRITLDCTRGDADFAWLVPEPSYIDNERIDHLVKVGLVPGQFAAAIQTIDLRTPVLSVRRASLHKFMPDEFSVGPTPTDPFDVKFFKNHELTKRTIEALEKHEPKVGSAASELLSILKMADGRTPHQRLVDEVAAYRTEIVEALTNPNRREGELGRLYGLALKVRKRVLNHETLGNLDETRGTLLFPIPAVTPVCEGSE